MENSFEQSKLVFEKMQIEINKLNINCYVMPSSNENSIPQLLIATDVDINNSPVIQLMFVDDLLQASDIKKDINSAFIVQFFAPINLKIYKETIEAYRILGIFNRVCPIGFFGMSESEGAFFRYNFLSKEKAIDPRVLNETVQIITFFVKKLSAKLIDLVSGEKTYEIILDELEKELSQVATK
ncbi:MAG: hypothetical protein H7263_01590 [Candidatus Sericytochromatia bacterium]|nr:hypothetical protein [Candidatus Sericytochromatia bacterium]